MDLLIFIFEMFKYRLVALVALLGGIELSLGTMGPGYGFYTPKNVRILMK